MKQFFTIIAITLLATSCGSKTYKTTENLKSAINGESTASALYTNFANKAETDSIHILAAMFRAMSASESIHAKNHLAALKELSDENYTPLIGDITAGATLENVNKAITGEMYEIEKMYPNFIETAAEEGVESALKSFRFANIVEGKHKMFCELAIAEIKSEESKDSSLNVEWLVCPVCGDIYQKSEIDTCCDICQTPIESFMQFK